MFRGRSRLRTAALLAAGGIALHQLRYAFVGASDGSDAVGSHGHEYLHALVPTIGLLLALAAGHFVALLARSARGRGRRAARTPFPTLWSLATGALLTAYVGQELVEVIVVHGSPPEFAALAGDGGWSAVPLAVAIGLLVALIERGAEAAIAAVSSGAPVAAAHAAARAPRAPRRADLPSWHVLARHLAGRAPPVPSV